MPRLRRAPLGGSPVVSHGIRIAQFTGATGGTYPEAKNVTIAGSPGIAADQIKGVLVLSSSVSALDSRGSTCRMSVGMCDTDLTQRCVAVMGEDAVAAASADTGYRTDTSTVVQITGVDAQGLQSEADITQFIEDGFELSFSAASGTTNGQAIIFHGEDVETDVQSFTSSASIGGTASITGLAFAPDFVIVASVGRSITTDGNGDEAMLSLGFAARTSDTQATFCFVAEDRQSPTSSGCITRNDVCCVNIASAAGTVSEGARIKVTSWNSDGVTFTTSNAATAVNAIVMCMRMPNTSAYCEAVSFPASTAGNFSISNCGFKPALILTSGGIQSVSNTVQAIRGSMNIGAMTSTEQGLISGLYRDNQATSDGHSVVSNSNSVHLVLSSTSDDWRAKHISMNDRGFTFSNLAVAGGVRYVSYLAVSIPYIIAADETESITESALLYLNHFIYGAETESISDSAVLVMSGMAPVIVSTETVSIDDGVVLDSVETVYAETVTITEQAQLVASGTVIGNETETITDGVVLYLGGIIRVLDETVTITDDLVTSERRRLGGWRGGMNVGGATAGDTRVAGAKRGETGG